MSSRCLWDKSHACFQSHKYPCDFLCEKCNKEVYEKYRALYTPKEFKANINKVKEQRERTFERQWTEGEAWIVKTMGLDTLVKIDLFDNDLV
jgi:hypothetical protein